MGGDTVGGVVASITDPRYLAGVIESMIAEDKARKEQGITAKVEGSTMPKLPQ